jgi:hypothetical protein
MSNARQAVLLEYGGLPDGVTISSQMCPSCRGGSSGEVSMSVGRHDGLLWWRCHRASCGFRGVHGGKSLGFAPAQHVKGRWNYEIEPLPEDWLEWLSNRFRILNELVDREWQWTDGYGGRVVMPVRNERGIITGYNLRSYADPSTWTAEQKQGHRKSLVHRIAEQVGQCWYQGCPYPTHILVVEDQPSALRASQITGINSIALLGTTMPDSLIETIKWRYDYKPTVVVALDQDATGVAVDNATSARRLYDNVKVLALDEDIKDMSQETFMNTMNEVKGL